MFRDTPLTSSLTEVESFFLSRLSWFDCSDLYTCLGLLPFLPGPLQSMPRQQFLSDSSFCLWAFSHNLQSLTATSTFSSIRWRNDCKWGNSILLLPGAWLLWLARSAQMFKCMIHLLPEKKRKKKKITESCSTLAAPWQSSKKCEQLCKCQPEVWRCLILYSHTTTWGLKSGVEENFYNQVCVWDVCLCVVCMRLLSLSGVICKVVK